MGKKLLIHDDNRMVIIVPVGKCSAKTARKRLKELRQSYKEELKIK